MRSRITTRKQWRIHRRRFFSMPSAFDRSKSADIAAIHSNYMHNPQTGFNEFAKDTPAWIVRLAVRYGWIHHKGNMAWS
jgi:hypothetical protein